MIIIIMIFNLHNYTVKMNLFFFLNDPTHITREPDYIITWTFCTWSILYRFVFFHVFIFHNESHESHLLEFSFTRISYDDILLTCQIRDIIHAGCLRFRVLIFVWCSFSLVHHPSVKSKMILDVGELELNFSAPSNSGRRGTRGARKHCGMCQGGGGDLFCPALGFFFFLLITVDSCLTLHRSSI